MLKTRDLSTYQSVSVGFGEVSLIDLAGTWIRMSHTKKKKKLQVKENKDVS